MSEQSREMSGDGDDARANWRLDWAAKHGVPFRFVETEEKFQELVAFIRRQPAPGQQGTT